MSDLISRQAAIDALNKMKIYRPLDSDRYVISDCLNKIVNLPSAQPETHDKRTETHARDLIDRQAAIDALIDDLSYYGSDDERAFGMSRAIGIVEKLPPAQPENIARDIATIIENEKDMRVILDHQWIPVSERLPEDIRPVIVTWCNTDPASYYQYIVGKRFIGVAHYKSGKWYWYSSTTEDFLAEYGRYDGEEFDEAIEVFAWCELPDPWKGEQG